MDLAQRFEEIESYKETVVSIEKKAGNIFPAGGLWGASASLFLAALSRRFRIITIVPDEETAEDIQDDLRVFGINEKDITLLPTMDSSPEGEPDPMTFRKRLIALEEIRKGPGIAIFPVPALAQHFPSPEIIARHRITVRPGLRLDPDSFLKKALEAGFKRVPLVAGPGEVSLRGDILDIYPVFSRYPARIEILDEEIEQVRLFDPESQKSIRVVDSHEMLLFLGKKGEMGWAPVVEWINADHENTLIAEIEPAKLKERKRALAEISGEHVGQLEDLDDYFSSFPIMP